MTNHDSPDESPKKSATSIPPEESQSLFDKVVPDSVRRGVESLLREGRFKHLMGEMKLPKEVISHIMGQIDETKQAAVSAIGREVRLFLEHTSIGDELAKLLTQVSFQVKTEIRFVPNELRQSKTKPKERARKAPRPSLWPLRPIVTNEVATAAPEDEPESDPRPSK